MWRSAMLGVASIALFASVSAQAADLPGAARTAPPSMIAPTPVYQWDGFYVGLNGGYGWGRSNHTSTITPGGSSGDFDTNGGLFGATVGYNYNAGSFVVGLEADLDVTWIDGSTTFTTGTIATLTATWHRDVPIALARHLPGTRRVRLWSMASLHHRRRGLRHSARYHYRASGRLHRQ